MTLDSHVKRTLSVYETCDVRIQPFLLIDRTRDIVTAHEVNLRSRYANHERVVRDTRCFQHLAEFIDSAVISLSRDVLNPARVPL